jgi:ankyrin repeat protein
MVRPFFTLHLRTAAPSHHRTVAPFLRRSIIASLVVCATVWLTVLAAVSPVSAAGDLRLVSAVKDGDRQTVVQLLRSGLSADAGEPDGTTPLHWAVRAGDLDTARLLLGAGARATAANRYGVTPLALAATNGDADAIRMLLEAGADPNTTTADGETVLMTAARTGRVEAARALIVRGAKVNGAEGWMGETALMWAAAEGHADMVTLLAEAGADLNARATSLEFPKITFNGSTMVSTPLPRGGMTALLLAAREGSLAGTRALADAGADLNIADRDGTTPLIMAIVNRHNDVAGLLIEKGAELNAADSTGMTALYAAVDLRQLGPLINRPTPKQTGEIDNLALVSALLDRGANPNARLRLPILPRFHNAGDAVLAEGATPLMRAARGRDIPVMRLLFDKGADPNLATRNYTTALMFAAGLGGGRRGATQSQAVEAVQMCLDHGADVRAFNNAGTTALHAATEAGADPIVTLLAEHGADLDVQDKSGRTPLDIAMGVSPGGFVGRRGAAPGQVRESTAALLKQLASGAARAGTSRP